MTTPANPPQDATTRPPEPPDEQPAPTVSKHVQLELDILQSEYAAARDQLRALDEDASTEP